MQRRESPRESTDKDKDKRGKMKRQIAVHSRTGLWSVACCYSVFHMITTPIWGTRAGVLFFVVAFVYLYGKRGRGKGGGLFGGLLNAVEGLGEPLNQSTERA